MSFKQYIPDIDEQWDEYWKKTSIKDELELVKTDGLKPLFNKYLPKQGKILEAGCGLAKWVISLTKQGYNIQGVDNNQFVVNKVKKLYPQIKIEKADVINLPYKDGSFDIYLSLGVVEHFEAGPKKALNEALRVLKKDGIVFIEVPYDSPLRILTRILTRFILIIKTPLRIIVETARLRPRRKKIKSKFYEFRYTRNELRKFLQDSGFVNINIFPKDDLSPTRSFALWLDYPKLQKKGGKIFELNQLGVFVKKLLETISPFTYSALIVAIAKKPK